LFNLINYFKFNENFNFNEIFRRTKISEILALNFNFAIDECYLPLGTTDSEYIFSYLLRKIEKRKINA